MSVSWSLSVRRAKPGAQSKGAGPMARPLYVPPIEAYGSVQRHVIEQGYGRIARVVVVVA